MTVLYWTIVTRTLRIKVPAPVLHDGLYHCGPDASASTPTQAIVLWAEKHNQPWIAIEPPENEHAIERRNALWCALLRLGHEESLNATEEELSDALFRLVHEEEQRAVARERERCAGLVEKLYSENPSDTYNQGQFDKLVGDIVDPKGKS